LGRQVTVIGVQTIAADGVTHTSGNSAICIDLLLNLRIRVGCILATVRRLLGGVNGDHAGLWVIGTAGAEELVIF
jgi:hypothetical protein